jgi:hypothetical protein
VLRPFESYNSTFIAKVKWDKSKKVKRPPQDTFLRDEAALLSLRVMFFRQVQQHGDNFSYVIADDAAREAAAVDSSFNAGEIMHILKTGNFTLKYIINTHIAIRITQQATRSCSLYSARKSWRTSCQKLTLKSK